MKGYLFQQKARVLNINEKKKLKKGNYFFPFKHELNYLKQNK